MTATEKKREQVVRHVSLALAVMALALLLVVAARGRGPSAGPARPDAPTAVVRAGDGTPGVSQPPAGEDWEPHPTGEVTAAAPADTRGGQGTAAAGSITATPPPTPTGTSHPTATPSPRPTARPTTGVASATPPAPTAEPPTPRPTATASPTPTVTPTNLPTKEPTRPPTLALGDVTDTHVGTTLTVGQAGIAEVFYLSRGIKYILTDATGSLTLVVWQDVLENVPGRLDLLPGSRVRVTGEIEVYEGQLEIVPAAGTDVVVLDRGARLPVEEWPVSRISASDVGRVLIVAGRVGQVEGERWLNVRLSDGTGEIVVYLPERLMPYLPPGISPGAGLRVAGQVDVYRGVLEIIPLAAADVRVGP